MRVPPALGVLDLYLVTDGEVGEAADPFVLGLARDPVLDAVDGEGVVADGLDDALRLFLVAEGVLDEVASGGAEDEQGEGEALQEGGGCVS